MKMKPLAAPAIEVVKKGEIKFYPENWSKTYFQWLENIEDWCISRQLWWGYRIPAWYDSENNIYVGYNEQEVRAKYNLPQEILLQQDEDVLDTWYSSALWSFATLGWPEPTYELENFHPTNVLVTGFDIIFFWVARMVMLSLKFTQQIPFKEVYVTGLIRDHEGQKMSKTKGNVLDPIDLIDGIDIESLIAKRTEGLMQPQMAKKIEQVTRKQFPAGIPAFGTDALRFTYCALASPTRDIRFDLGRVDGYRNFCNKLWNAARFVLMNTEDKDCGIQQAKFEFTTADHWIRSRLERTIEQAHTHFKDYRFDLLTHTIYEFVWNEYCDWYLELAKPVLNDAENIPAQTATRNTLIYVLESVLRLLHPLMPFITEEIWQRVAPLAGKTGNSIMLESYPIFTANNIHVSAESEIEWIKNVTTTIRTIRSEMSVAPGKKIPLLCKQGSSIDKSRFATYQTLIVSLTKIDSIGWLGDDETPPPAAIGLVGNLQLLIPMAGLIDVNAETNRIKKELEKLVKESEKAQAKLDNESFVKNAPESVVKQEQARVTEFEAAIVKLQAQLQTLNV